MKMLNQVKLTFAGRSVNEGFARAALAAFLVQLDPTVPQLADINTAVSEAVTNAIIQAYDSPEDKVVLACKLEGRKVEITVRDTGRGIDDIGRAMEPFYTTRPELERSGMGFAFMEAFMDEVRVTSEAGKGTCVWMCKRIGVQEG